MRNAYLDLFFIFLLFSASNAVSIGNCAAATFDSYIEIMKGPLGVLMFSIVLALALIYMIANAFHRPEYIVLVKDESFHLLISVMLLVFFGLGMEIGCGVVGSAFDFAYKNISKAGDPCYLPEESVQKIAVCSMQMMENDANELINAYTKKNIDLQVEASAYISYFGITGGATFGPDAYLRAHAIFIDNVKNMFTLPAYLSIRAQNIIMQFFLGTGTYTGAIIQYLIPVAFLMRFIPFFRQIGNIMIGLAVAIFIIVPVFIALNGIMYLYIFTPEQCSQYSDLVYDNVFELSGASGCNSSINILKVARLYPQAFLLPNLTIVIFITFVNSLNKALKVLG
ncbi:MAG: hypothetical protein AB1391_01235 [Candidatus Micrarchaeota archaeon]